MNVPHRIARVGLASILTIAAVAMTGCAGGSARSDDWAINSPVLEADVNFVGVATDDVLLGVRQD